MIRKITISNCRSYKESAVLETDKNINIIYGINGSGKSTLSEFLRTPSNPHFSDCRIEPDMDLDSEEILVYNEQYVDEVFYDSDTQKGIFSLSKENADARKEIDKAETSIKELSDKLQLEKKNLSDLENRWKNKKDDVFNRLWEIKQRYSGGDRVLEYCLDGLKRSKETLSQYLLGLPLLSVETPYSVDDLKREIQQLNKFNGNPISKYSRISFVGGSIEKDPLFKEVITGNKGSRVARLIDELHNSDWVKAGMRYSSDEVCPFCQRPYDDDILSELGTYFNKEFEEALESINFAGARYAESLQNMPNVNLRENELVKHLSDAFERVHSRLIFQIKSNLDLIRKKHMTPSHIVELTDTSASLKEVNDILDEANTVIEVFNGKLFQIQKEKSSIKKRFWDLMRIDYNVMIEDYQKSLNEYQSDKDKIVATISKIEDNIKSHRLTIQNELGKIVNIDTAVSNINSMLLDMAITDFKLVKCPSEEGLYRIVRNDEEKSVFNTLSEGERTIISVLYFIETCKGLMEKGSNIKKRIIVIDDPVSSLSNLYVFNIGRLLREEFFPDFGEGNKSITSKYEQVFILTHSLYFLYELAEMNSRKRHLSQGLFRISKNENGSHVEELHYDHIQSDYHAYWAIANDPNSNPALVANCIRNIIEYFFGFIEKTELNVIFGRDKFKNPKYQALYRYINRESHSLGHNIIDFKDFDHGLFQNVLRDVFIEAGYEEHFNKMSSI